MPIEGIFSNTIELLGKSIDLRAKNHNHISANLANAETPNYIPATLSFEGELRDALKSNKSANPGKKAVSHPRHIPLKGQANSLASVEGRIVETPAPGIGRDGNAVELEQEMGKLAANQIMYNASVQIIGKKFEGLKSAIKGQ
ncbi:flagellar basal body rod protein FlgB [Geobacter pelophilus]|jgi:flagellar basal-body rod protein FlgB|uniref:Flagellar basal body rod protein FlgB n=1 Tax=Geoanaerobacter pelophilus TaxID=60036 RepID=A0AAW4L2E4_9BACT|nr:flagellar basal body rod protein FlgB [Geoanaerobacter pelophilus]MBT0663975.1 flagellar basal body rod protein FlgB [Geoanaerobacter pelophilus]